MLTNPKSSVEVYVKSWQTWFSLKLQCLTNLPPPPPTPGKFQRSKIGLYFQNKCSMYRGPIKVFEPDLNPKNSAERPKKGKKAQNLAEVKTKKIWLIDDINRFWNFFEPDSESKNSTRGARGIYSYMISYCLPVMLGENLSFPSWIVVKNVWNSIL